jgi:hypothetical protein
VAAKETEPAAGTWTQLDGEWRLAGWFGSENVGIWGGPKLVACPRCGAACLGDTWGDGPAISRHEDWHARTDYPRPEP